MVQFPETIGGCIDELYRMRAARLALSKQVDEAKAAENLLEEHILNTFSKSDLNGAKGTLATAGVKRTTVYQLANWDAFIDYVSTTNSWDLLRKQPGATACKARFENGEAIPGIEPYNKVDLSLTKI